jgi:hypothetical protein
MLPAPALVIAEIAAGDSPYILIHNNTDAPVPVEPYWFCAHGIYYSALSAINDGVTAIPPRGFVMYEYEDMFNSIGSTPESGELLLFEGENFPDEAKAGDDALSYVCWGTNEGSHARKPSGAKRFMGDCAPSMTNGAIRRIPGTSGEDAASYDSTVTPNACQ